MKNLFIFGFLILITNLSCNTRKTMQSIPITYSKFKASQQYFNSSDGKIAFIDKGNGPVLFLLHGIPTSSWLYRNMIDSLVDKGYRVIAPDMLGFGNSDNPKGYDLYSPENHANRIVSLMNHLNIDKWTHVFHDVGGIWTWELLRNHKDRISNLIILNTLILEEGFNPPIRMKKGNMAKFSMWMYRNGISTKPLLKNLFRMGLKDKKLTKEELEGYKVPLKEGKTRGMYRFFTTTCNEFPDYSEVFKEISQIPKLVIWGKSDSMLQWDPQKEKALKQLNITKENVQLLDAKHFIQEEKPMEIVALIDEFLSA